MSEPVVAPFRPSPVGAVLDGAGAAGRAVEESRAAGWAAGWAAGTRAAAEAARAQRASQDAEHWAAQAAREAQVAAALAVLRRAADAAGARVVPVLEAAAASLDEGAVLLAQAVLGAELAQGPDRARAALARALSLPSDAGVHTVRLHPADLAVLSDAAGDLPVELPAGVELVADPTLRPGDAVSELPDGFLDARIATAVERAMTAIAGAGDGA
ncbi:FliH/SctL family protein [uncultured Cellulomonas sp.]|uniref:FliH/SctL family protein n=1 Tax=uncultured Cellulomonas sp. TaxID=189682 RepID=UPI00261F84CD|nr:FliH/SctL family protein [uncultured Cellulomonas sp.]